MREILNHKLWLKPSHISSQHFFGMILYWFRNDLKYSIWPTNSMASFHIVPSYRYPIVTTNGRRRRRRRRFRRFAFLYSWRRFLSWTRLVRPRWRWKTPRLRRYGELGDRKWPRRRLTVLRRRIDGRTTRNFGRRTRSIS